MGEVKMGGMPFLCRLDKTGSPAFGFIGGKAFLLQGTGGGLLGKWLIG
jgi:hypothetical protein